MESIELEYKNQLLLHNNRPTYQGNPPLILIGPKGVGKSTIARMLARRLQLPHRSMDQYCWSYYVELPEIEQYYQQLPDAPVAEKLDTVAKRWLLLQAKESSDNFGQLKAKMELHATRRMLEEFQQGVIDFGAGHSVFQRSEDCQKMKALLSGRSCVVLLLPSYDIEESMGVLAKNLNAEQRIFQDMQLNYYLSNPSNRYLAEHVILTQGKTPEQTLAELIDLLNGNS